MTMVIFRQVTFVMDGLGLTYILSIDDIQQSDDFLKD